MGNDLVGRAHHSGPSIAIITDGVQTKGTQRIATLLVFTQCNCRAPFPEQVCQVYSGIVIELSTRSPASGSFKSGSRVGIAGAAAGPIFIRASRTPVWSNLVR